LSCSIAPILRAQSCPFLLKTDAIINYNKAAGFLENPPSLELCPDFANILTLRKHVIKVLSQLSCPQSAIHGWSGLTIDPVKYPDTRYISKHPSYLLLDVTEHLQMIAHKLSKVLIPMRKDQQTLLLSCRKPFAQPRSSTTRKERAVFR
jgi:hypothetical protein